MNISCSFNPNSNFTVGETRTLNCQGEFSDISLKTLTFLNLKKSHSLKILNTNLISPKQLQITLTGYQTGNYFFPSLELTDGIRVYVIKDISWTIPSVLKKDSQMYPPYGPWSPQLPMWFMGCLVLLGVCLTSLIFIRVKNTVEYRMIQRRVLKRLKGKTSVDLFIQKTIPLVTQDEIFKDLNQATFLLKTSFDEYLENQFGISVFVNLKKRKKLIKNKKIKNSNKLIQIVLELNRLEKKEVIYSQKDLKELIHMVRAWVFEREGK